MMIPLSSYRTLLILLTFIFPKTLSVCSKAQTAPQLHKPVPGSSLSPTPGERLKLALTKISQNFKVCFVVEGEPLITMKTKPFVLKTENSLEKIVHNLAEEYDFDVIKKKQVFIYKKRYTDPADLPDITLGECREAFKNIQIMNEQFGFDFPKDGINHYNPVVQIKNFMETFTSSFTAEQIDGLSQNGIPCSSLSIEQKKVLRSYMVYTYLREEALAGDSAGKIFERILKNNAAFEYKNIQDIHAFGFSFDERFDKLNDFYALSHQNKITNSFSNGPTVASHTRTSIINGVRVIDEIPDTSDPSLLNTDPTSIPLSGKETVSLNEALRDINSLPNGDGIVYRINPALGEKRVILTGSEFGEAADEIDALTNVYGLRLVRTNEHSAFISFPQYTYPIELNRLGDALRKAIPNPLLRAITANSDPKLNEVSNGYITTLDNINKRCKELELQSVRWVRATVEADLERSGKKSIPFSKASELHRKLIALFFAANGVNRILGTFTSQPPSRIYDFEKIMLHSTIITDESHKKMFQLDIATPDRLPGSYRTRVSISIPIQ